MSTVAKLLARKERLPEQLESDPGPNERAEIERLLAQIETALSLLEPGDAAAPSEESCQFLGSQRAEIVRHLAELPDQLGIAEFPAGRVSGPRKGDRAGAAWFPRERFGARDGGVGAQALHRFARRDPVSAMTNGNAT